MPTDTKLRSSRSTIESELQRDFERFLAFFKMATAKVANEYMQLPVAGKEAPDYRERVYCYELYHCLRTVITDHRFPYTLSGEVDKTGHPYIRGNILDRVKPDFVVHAPGDMERNLVVIEVKPVVGTEKRGIRKDLRCLTAFRRIGPYRYAIYLIYGDDDQKFAQIKAKAVSLGQELGEQEIDLNLIDLYLHRRGGQQAEKQDWF